VGWAGGIRPRPSALRPKPRAFMMVCPPQSHQRQAGLKGREPGAGRRLRTFSRRKYPPPPRRGGTGAERAVGWPGGIRPRLGALRHEPRAFMTVCPSQSHQRQAGLRGREQGAGRRLRTFARRKYSPPSRRGGDRCGASGGVARRDPSSTQRTPSGTARLYYSATERGDIKRPIGLGGVERKSGFSWDAF